MALDKKGDLRHLTEDLEEIITGHSVKILMLFSHLSDILLFYFSNKYPEKSNTTSNK